MLKTLSLSPRNRSWNEALYIFSCIRIECKVCNEGNSWPFVWNFLIWNHLKLASERARHTVAMFIVGVALVVSSLLAPIYGSSVFRYNKLEDNYLTSNLIYPTNNGVKVLTQLDSVETWLALQDCAGQGCEPLNPTYTAIPVFPYDLAAHYKCQVVGKGKPVLQSLCVDLSGPLFSSRKSSRQLTTSTASFHPSYPTETLYSVW